MHLPISARLLACAACIRPGERVADIGCDHGYLGIHLLTGGITGQVFACDVKEGPLASARRNARKYGVADRMQFYLSDGVQAVPREFDVLVCAGMGGDTIVSILESAPWLRSSQYRLILQCQSKTPLLRRYLSEQGWHIQKEQVLRDGRFLYTVIEAVYAPQMPRLSLGQWYFPPALAENSTPETAEYRQRTMKKLQISVDGHGANADPEEVEALVYLKEVIL